MGCGHQWSHAAALAWHQTEYSVRKHEWSAHTKDGGYAGKFIVIVEAAVVVVNGASVMVRRP